MRIGDSIAKVYHLVVVIVVLVSVSPQ